MVQLLDKVRILEEVFKAIPAGVKIYLTGGFVRDLLLSRESQDVDFLVTKEVHNVANKVASLLKGHVVVLDRNLGIYRVVIKVNSVDFYLDFQKIRGKEIKEHINYQDFTINSISMKLDDFLVLRSALFALSQKRRSCYAVLKKYIIDHAGGVSDIKNKLIRHITNEIFDIDPLRMLRAYRFAAQLGFKIAHETIKLIENKKSLVDRTSGERIRDELFKILSSTSSFNIIESMDNVGLLEMLFPEISVMKGSVREFYYHPKGLWQHSLTTLKEMEVIFSKLHRMFPRWHSAIKVHLEEKLTSCASRAALLKFVSLFHDVGKPYTAQYIDNRMRFFGHERRGAELICGAMRRLKMSNVEMRTVKNIILSHMRPGSLASGVVTERAVYRFFRDIGEKDGLDVLLLSLADRYSYKHVRGVQKKKDIYRHKEVVYKILDTYYTSRERVIPPRIISGYDVMKICGVEEGPLVGKILKLVEEKQSSGEIKDRTDAINFLEKIKTMRNEFFI